MLVHFGGEESILVPPKRSYFDNLIVVIDLLYSLDETVVRGHMDAWEVHAPP